jgi:RNA polymerase sigma-70 factor (ECF subfamily)
VTNSNELLIVQNILQGDVNAFATLVEKYRDMAVGLAYNILLNRQDAEEVAQDAFVKAYRSLTSFKAESKFSTWLYRIIVNAALNKKKQVKTRSALWQKFISHNKPAGENTEECSNTSSIDKKQIHIALQSLNENERICISLFYLEELSAEEINEVTDLSISNIKVLLHRGRKRFYQSLQGALKNEIKDLL